MSTTSLTIAASPKEVFAVLADGWSYASWVVGASHIRDVDGGWPAKGTRIHHSVGAWPLLISDYTAVRDVVPEKLLELRARAWPFGEANVRLRLEPIEDEKTLVHMDEMVVRGPGSLLPDVAVRPLLKARNDESLRRLAHIALHRERASDEPA